MAEERKRTILKHEDRSKETWNIPKVRVKRHLKEHVRTKKRAFEYDAGKVGKIKVGRVRTEAGRPRGQSVLGKPKGKKVWGFNW